MNISPSGGFRTSLSRLYLASTDSKNAIALPLYSGTAMTESGYGKDASTAGKATGPARRPPSPTVVSVDILQDGKQMIPYHLDGRDKQTLIGGVDITERRTETDHVHVGVFLGEEAAL